MGVVLTQDHRQEDSSETHGLDRCQRRCQIILSLKCSVCFRLMSYKTLERIRTRIAAKSFDRGKNCRFNHAFIGMFSKLRLSMTQDTFLLTILVLGVLKKICQRLSCKLPFE